MPDLITSSRVESAAVAAGGTFARVDDPGQLPTSDQVDVLVVDWGFRRADWGERLTAWRSASPGAAPKIVLFGPHTDLEAHQAARASELGPMRARSALFSGLPDLLSEFSSRPAQGT